MPVREQVLDRRQRRCLDKIDHDGSSEHGHSPAADPGGCMLGADQQICRSFYPDLQMRQVDHGQLPRRRLSARCGRAEGYIVPDAVREFNRCACSRRRPDKRQPRFRVFDLAQVRGTFGNDDFKGQAKHELRPSDGGVTAVSLQTICSRRAIFHILGQGRIEPAHMTAAARPGPDESLTYPVGDRADAALADHS